MLTAQLTYFCSPHLPILVLSVIKALTQYNTSLCKAFDRINIYYREHYKLLVVVTDGIYCTDRLQSIKTGKRSGATNFGSVNIWCTSGVNLRPILFSLYIYDVKKYFVTSKTYYLLSNGFKK